MEKIKINVLYLSYDGMTDPLGQSQVLPYLFGLAAKSVCIHLISFEKKERAVNIENIKEACQENGVVWHPQPYTKNPPLISTLFDIRRMKKVAHELHKAVHFDLVHCRSYIPAIAGRALQQKYNLKFVFDMRGFWPDERIEGGIWNKNNPIFQRAYAFFKQKEITFFNSADAIVSLTENGKKEIESWDNLPNKPQIDVIPCCVDIHRFQSDAINTEIVNDKRIELGISEKDFVLGYIGSIGTWYMLSEMLDYYAVLRTQKTESKFLFISKEPKENIIKHARKKNIPEEEIIVIGAPHNKVPTYISLFDFSIFFIRPTFSKKASSPTKQGELMSLGIPIICNSGVGDTDLIIKESGAGIVLETLDAENYRSFELEPNNYDKKKIKSGAEKWYSLEKGVNQYFDIYKRLCLDNL
ncbi:glycosyltransferase [Brumimicrobium salinarum]|uniref:Glycosyltransferase n=1 Tax=Brumimicrobium salinarum TaxID=2058658 RepID=A0A2I0R6K5_9FLAO|nr:glycosyltransferase [Brumimicrobium salinarum]PKR82216.1 glycosyltransferase [Brumimicrobium salinarum]